MRIVQPDMPSSVRKALILLIVTLLMDVVRLLLDPSYLAAGPNVPLPVAVVLTVAVTSLFIAGIANGRLWVAILMVVVAVPGILLVMWEEPFATPAGLFWIIWQTLNAVVTIAAVALIFGSPAREWFRKCKAARS